MTGFWSEYRDETLCADCGGKCCFVYGPPYNLTWERLHRDKGHTHGGGFYEEYGVNPLPQKIHPHACEYLGPNGCIIPWEKRPLLCRSYRCGFWRDLVTRR